MANVDDDLDLDVEGGKSSGGGKMKNIIIFSLIGILLIGLSVTTTLLLLGGGKEETATETTKTEAPAETHAAKEEAPVVAVKTGNAAYLDLTPPFVVNLDNQDSDIRYLQVAVSVMVRSEQDLEIVKKHMPVIRHNLVLLFSSLDFAEVRTTDGKIKLTENALKVVQEALKKVAGAPVVEEVYLPSIVGQ